MKIILISTLCLWIAVGCKKKPIVIQSENQIKPPLAVQEKPKKSTPKTLLPYPADIDTKQPMSETSPSPSVADTDTTQSMPKTSPSVDADTEQPMSEENPAMSSSSVVCHFPVALRKAVESSLQIKDCNLITKKNLSEVSYLKISEITQDQNLNSQYGKYFTKMTSLDISDNKSLSLLPEFATAISSLESLDISKTNINSFSKDICKLKNLKSLKGSHNNYQGREIPFHTFCLENLKILDVSYSSLEYIDEYIYKLKNLKELYIQNNSLVTIPFMMQFMNSLLVIDLTNNQLKEPNWLDRIFGYTEVNTVHSCKNPKEKSVAFNEEDQKDCTEDILSNLRCSWWYKIPHIERGPHFRRYKNMTDEEYAKYIAKGELPSKNKCYLFWLQNTYIPMEESVQASYDEHTINGKTLREWRMALNAMIEFLGYGWTIPEAYSYCSQKRLWYDTSYLPDSHELFPKDYEVEGGWNTLPPECTQDNHLYINNTSIIIQ